jgi:citrate synthase
MAVLPRLVGLNKQVWKGDKMTFTPGLKGIVAAETNLSGVDGEAGELVIAGYPLEAIAEHATNEEVVHLLWHQRLPALPELASLTEALKFQCNLPEPTVSLLREAAGKRLPVIDALRMAVSTFGLRSDGHDPHDAHLLVAALPTAVAAYWRLLHGQEPIAPHADLNRAANYLYMLSGEIPDAARIQAMTTYLNTIADHGMNASTFTARVVASTRSDFISAVVGAIGALKGSLHGGAPGPVLEMLREIGSPDNAESYLCAKLEAGERLMGFGHAIYRVRDPRADVLSRAAEVFFADSADRAFYDLAMHVEQVALRLLAEYKPGRRLHTNVEFYTALLLHGLGLDAALFTPTFAVGRVAGWTAHAFEQRALDRLIRPESVYTGHKNGHWVPLKDRAVA